jgi:cytochrome c biogenesis protein CcdA
MTFFSALLAALWLGLLTSVSPCPLATNIAAVSFLSRRMHSRRMAVAGAIAYAVGRAVVYVIIGLLVAFGLAAAPALSNFLQTQLLPFVGPVLILVALVLLDWIRLPMDFGFNNQKAAGRLAGLGLLGEFLLGMLFALTFCPVSAALFFGTLLPLAVATPVPLPVFAVYGLGTALPVGVLAVLIALGLASAGKLIAAIQHWQGRVRAATAAIILLVGLWLTLSSSLGLW